MKTKSLLDRILVLSLVTLLSGCHTLQKDDGIDRDWLGREIEIDYVTPSKVVAIWTNSVFNESGDAPMRGLGGRVYFYNNDHRPVRVNGKLSVYLYDDTDARPSEELQQEATKVVHFSPEEVQQKFSPSEFGASYSFWVPWDRVGGDRTQLSIIPVFTDETGHMLVGEQARQLLPGAEPVKVYDEAGKEVVHASYTTHSTETVKITTGAKAKPDAKKRVLGKSTTIKLPNTMQQRLRQPPARRPNLSGQANRKLRKSVPELVKQASHLMDSKRKQRQTIGETVDDDSPMGDIAQLGETSSEQIVKQAAAESKRAGVVTEEITTGRRPATPVFSPILKRPERRENKPLISFAKPKFGR